MDQLEEKILQTDQLKKASKRLQHHVDYTQRLMFEGILFSSSIKLFSLLEFRRVNVRMCEFQILS